MFDWPFPTHRISAFWVCVVGPASRHFYVIDNIVISMIFSYLTLAALFVIRNICE